MASALGGGRMGGVALAASTVVPQSFSNIIRGAVAKIWLSITVSGKSTGAAFAAVVDSAGSAAAEGVDDLDKLVDGLITNIALYFDPYTLVGSLAISRWRTVLGFLNHRDFVGSFVNGVSIPISTGANGTWTITIPFPVELTSLFSDGAIFRSGSRRLREGSIEYTGGASLTPSIVLANGTIAVASVSVNLLAQGGVGSEYDVGNTWRVTRPAGMPTDAILPAGLRLALADVSAAASNAVTAYDTSDWGLAKPTDLQARYQGEVLADGGFDVTARCTPISWVGRGDTFASVAMRGTEPPRVSAVSGVSSLGFYDILAMPPAAHAIQSVATAAGGGAPVSIAHPTPPSLPPGTRVPPALAHYLPVRPVLVPNPAPGRRAPRALSPHEQAVAAERRQLNGNAQANAVLSRLGMPFRR